MRQRAAELSQAAFISKKINGNFGSFNFQHTFWLKVYFNHKIYYAGLKLQFIWLS